MRRGLLYVLLFVLFCCIGTVNGQSVKVDLSPRHQKKLANTKDYKKKFLRHKKYVSKDSLKQTKVRIRAYEWKLDSLEKQDNQRREVFADIGNIQDRVLPDTLAVSFDYLKQVASDGNHAQELEQLNQLESKYGPIIAVRDSMLNGSYRPMALAHQQDSLIAEQGQQAALNHLSSAGGSEFGQLAQQSSLTQNPLSGEVGQAKAYSDMAQSITKKEPNVLHTGNLTEDQLTKLKSTQAKMKVDKLKYAEIGDSNDLSTAKKHRSLKGVPAKKRMYLGGNIHISSTDPIVFEIAPQVGYYFNKKWAAGIGFSYKDYIGKLSEQTNQVHYSYGYHIFSSYNLHKNIFAYGEYGRDKNDRLFAEKSPTARWTDRAQIGLGLNISISSKLDGHILLLYDVMDNSRQQFLGLPVVLKFGFKISEIGRSKLFSK